MSTLNEHFDHDILLNELEGSLELLGLDMQVGQAELRLDLSEHGFHFEIAILVLKNEGQEKAAGKLKAIETGVEFRPFFDALGKVEAGLHGQAVVNCVVKNGIMKTVLLVEFRIG